MLLIWELLSVWALKQGGGTLGGGGFEVRLSASLKLKRRESLNMCWSSLLQIIILKMLK